jgi:carbamoyl-phosphate synthase large subunit
MNDGTEDEMYEKRKAAGITRVYKMVDTCALSLKQRLRTSILRLKVVM